MRPPSVNATVPPEVESRVSLTTHDFFSPQPVSADLYYFRWIFHNWSDVYAVRILQALIPALKPGARVLINDGILPEVGSVGGMEEKSIRFVVSIIDRCFYMVLTRYMFLEPWIFCNS